MSTHCQGIDCDGTATTYAFLWPRFGGLSDAVRCRDRVRLCEKCVIAIRAIGEREKRIVAFEPMTRARSKL